MWYGGFCLQQLLAGKCDLTALAFCGIEKKRPWDNALFVLKSMFTQLCICITGEKYFCSFFQYIYSFVYLLTYLLTNLHTCLLTYLFTYLFSFLPNWFRVLEFRAIFPSYLFHGFRFRHSVFKHNPWLSIFETRKFTTVRIFTGKLRTKFWLV